ncbi:hypothetical protein HYH03_013201 [Edaphochlamys debaryana]|uniref:PI3K/PI4K catalytic domain-containing protein n=1 Tax=Edaphochlamys debaryana TaxID=47281 RepID=A0A835XNK3_9CHLO|nr:hypothetical protein HYH03_013201 [Edaphochlamys debaryana]|eukprot:KAG2488207.1 hypothetical protein HYH03_013201 [Edaphochlamys debaryana]
MLHPFAPPSPAAPSLVRSGVAVVKMPCLPLAKIKGNRPPGVCDAELILQRVQHLIALDKLSCECGFTDIVPRVWLAPVRGVVPGIGYPIDWWGLWMEYVEGVSLENFLYRGWPRMLARRTQMEVFNNKLNKTRVYSAAIFDLLTSQCDRHAQNVMIQEEGNIILIDNDVTLNHIRRICGFDSIFVPTTLKYEAARTANHWVLKVPGGDTVPKPPDVDFQVLLDYRCALPEGQEAMGTSYPPQLTVSLVSPRPSLRVTQLNKGYECAHPYEPVWELPFGNPLTGGAWDHDRPDIGTYEGGTFPEDPPDAGLGGEGEELPSPADRRARRRLQKNRA